MSYSYATMVKPNAEFYQHVITSRINLIDDFLYSINKNIVIPNIKNLYFYKDETFTKYRMMIYDKKYHHFHKEIFYFNSNNYLYSKKSIYNILSKINQTIYIDLDYMDYSSSRFLSNFLDSNIKISEKEMEKHKENKRIKYLYEMCNFIRYDVIALNNHFNSNNVDLFRNNLNQLYKFEDAIQNYRYIISPDNEFEDSIKDYRIRTPYNEFPSNTYTTQEKTIISRIFSMLIYAFEKRLDITIPCICDKLNIKFDMDRPFHFKPLHLLVLSPYHSPTFYPKQIGENTYIHAIQGDGDVFK